MARAQRGPLSPARYTVPQTTYKQYLTTYVNDTRAKSATPLLLTSINRNNWNGSNLSDTHGAFPPAVRELAASLEVELIDLTSLSKGYFERRRTAIPQPVLCLS